MKILKEEPSNTLLDVSMWTVQPDHIAHPFLISVQLPNGPAPAGGWPGIVAMDGNMSVGTLNVAGVYMAMSNQIAPSAIITIGYPLDNDPPFIVARNKDLTPTAWPEWDAPYGEILQMSAPPSGRADAFLAFVNEELKPEIETRFQVNPNEWTLVGHSLGGLFTTHALLSDASRFRRYLAFGSSYWWHAPAMFERAARFAAEAEPVNIAVYLAAGDHETREKALEVWGPVAQTPLWQRYLGIMGGVPDIAADTERMAKILGQRPGVHVTSQILFNETHGSAALAAVSQGLGWLHKVLPPALPPA